MMPKSKLKSCCDDDVISDTAFCLVTGMITDARRDAGMRRSKFTANKTRREKKRLSERLRRQQGLFLC